MICMLLGTGFEETEAIAPLDLMRRAGISVVTAGISGKVVTGSHGIPVTTDMEIGEVDLTALEGVILPGGLGGVASLRSSPQALDLIRFAWDNHLLTAAICAGPTVLADLGITDGRKATCYPGCEDKMGSAQMVENAAVVTDGSLITGTSAGCAIPFGLALIAAIKGQEAADTVARQIVIR